MEEVGTEQGLGVDSGWLEVRKSGKRGGVEVSLRGWQVTWGRLSVDM